MKKEFLFGLAAAFFMFSCGEGSEETTESGDTTATDSVVEEVVVMNYEIDTAASVINWMNFDDEETDHYGTVKVLSGSYTIENDVITEASLSADMNTITSDDDMGGERLEGHFMSPDFFDVNQFAAATFTFDRHEEGMVYGTLNTAGMDFNIEAPVTITEGSIEVGEFKVDMSALAYFEMEKEKEKDESKWHDPMIGFTATIVGM